MYVKGDLGTSADWKPDEIQLRADTMGSNEFEMGALAQACRAIQRKPMNATTTMLDIEGATRRIYIVAPSSFPRVIDAFETWIKGGLDSKQPSYFELVAKGLDFEGHRLTPALLRQKLPIAWFSLDDGIFWSFEPRISTQWLTTQTKLFDDVA